MSSIHSERITNHFLGITDEDIKEHNTLLKRIRTNRYYVIKNEAKRVNKILKEMNHVT